MLECGRSLVEALRCGLRATCSAAKRSIANSLGLPVRYLRHEGGNIAVLTAVLLVPMVGIVGMAVEASSWLVMGRAAQNAADSAAVASANNATSTLQNSYPQHAWEGWAAGREYGFAKSASPTLTSGTCSAPYQAYTCSKAAANNAVVEIASGVTCPDATTKCHLAIVTKKLPIFLTRAVGYLGDTTVGTGRGVTVVSFALAEPISAVSFTSCITAVGSDAAAPGSGANQKAITGDGTPNAGGAGCSLSAVGPAPSSIACNGHDLGAYYGFATGTISGSGGLACTTVRTTNASFVFCDPYAATPASGCPATSYASTVANAVSSAPNCSGGAATSTTMSGTLTGSYYCYNRNVRLTGNVTGQPTDGSVVVVTDGASVDINSLAARNVTFIFTKGTATNPGSFNGSNSGVTLAAPESGSLKGIAAYQIAPNACTHTVCDDWTINGNRTVDITGLVYMPFTNASYGGAVSSGNCFISVYNSFSVNGTGNVLDRSGCSSKGPGTLPTVLRYRAALVK